MNIYKGTRAVLLLLLAAGLAACGGGGDAYSGETDEVFPSLEPAQLVPVDSLPVVDSAGAGEQVNDSSSSSSEQSGSQSVSERETAKEDTKKKKKQPEVFRGTLNLVSNSCPDAVASIKARFPVKRKGEVVSIELSNGLVLTGSGNKKAFSASVSLPQSGGVVAGQTISSSKINKRKSDFTLDISMSYPDDSGCSAVYQGVLNKQ